MSSFIDETVEKKGCGLWHLVFGIGAEKAQEVGGGIEWGQTR